MKTKKNQQELEPQPQPEILTSFLKYEDLRCMGQHFSKSPSEDLKIQSQIMELLVSTNHHGLENVDRDEMWSCDVDTREICSARDPENRKPFLDHLRGLGGHLFILCKREDDKFHIPISELIRIWNVNDLPPSVNKVFQMVPEGLDGIEFIGEFDPENYSLLKLRVNLN